MKIKLKKNLIYLLLTILLALLPIISASEINTSSYSANSFHIGIAGTNASTSSYEFRYTTTYQQGSNRDVATLSYSANSGWLNNSLYINNDALPEETTCDSEHLNLCINDNECTNVGGYWYNNICNNEEEPTTETPSGGRRRTVEEDEETGEEKTEDKEIKEEKTIYIEDKEIEKEIIKTLKKGEEIKLKIKENGQTHEYFIKLSKIQKDNVLIKAYLLKDEITIIGRIIKKITGKTIFNEEKLASFRLNKGEEKKLDLIKDGYYDINIKLEEIKESKAVITINPIKIKSETEKTEPPIEKPKLNILDKLKLYKSPLIISLILILVLLMFITKKVKKPRLKKKTLKSIKKLETVKIKGYLKIRYVLKNLLGLIKGLLNQISELAENKIKLSKKLRSIQLKTILTIFICINLIGVLIMKPTMTGFVVGSKEITNNLLGVIYFAFIIGGLGLLIFLHKKNIKKIIETRNRNKYAINSLKGLIKKKVYTNDGDYVGKVKEVMLKENKIHSLKIKLDKKFRGKGKGIIAKYKGVLNVGHIVIVRDKIMEKINP